MEPPTEILVRATIHLSGLGLGSEALVDPSEPYIADCLRAGYVVPVDEAYPSATPRGTMTAENPNAQGRLIGMDAKFGEHVLFNGEAGDDQFGHIINVRENGNADVLYKETGGGMEVADDVPYRGAADRKTDGGGHTYHHHGD